MSHIEPRDPCQAITYIIIIVPIEVQRGREINRGTERMREIEIFEKERKRGTEYRKRENRDRNTERERERERE